MNDFNKNKKTEYIFRQPIEQKFCLFIFLAKFIYLRY